MGNSSLDSSTEPPTAPSKAVSNCCAIVKVIAANLVPRSVILQEIKRHQQIHSHKLSEYQQIEQDKFPDASQLTFEQKCIYATLRCGIGYESYRINWCQEAIALLNET